MVWAFGTLAEDQLPHFAFQLYDTDNSGRLEQRKVEGIIHEVYDLANADKKNQGFGQVRESSDVRIEKSVQGIRKFLNIDGGSAMNVKGFTGYVQHHQMALFPAFVMRNNIRSHICDAMTGFQVRGGLTEGVTGFKGKRLD